MPIIEVIKTVVAPMKKMSCKVIADKTIKKEHLSNKYSPAVTIVAAWIMAETGVGPSIASGNQICKPACADLLIAATSKQIQIRSIYKKLTPGTIAVFK